MSLACKILDSKTPGPGRSVLQSRQTVTRGFILKED